MTTTSMVCTCSPCTCTVCPLLSWGNFLVMIRSPDD